MSTVTFDKLTYVSKLEASGISREQATAQADALDAALRETVATKHDLELFQKEVDGDLKLIKWGMGIILAAVVFPLLRGLFA